MSETCTSKLNSWDTNQLRRGRASVSTTEPSPVSGSRLRSAASCVARPLRRRNRALPRLRHLARQRRLQQHIEIGVCARRWVVVLEEQLLALEDERAALLQALVRLGW